MNKTSSFLMLIALLFCLQLHAQSFLKASDTNIVNEQGENVLLRGIGLGGWMLQEGYMLHLNGSNPQFSIRKRIEDISGADETQEFYDVWLSNFVRKIDIDSLHAWGFNSVRLPMHYNLYTLPADEEPEAGKNTWLQKGFQLTDSLIEWCRANNMYVILDLHAAPGGQGNDINISDRDTTKPSLWQSEANKQKTIALWHKLAERYANEPVVAAYDLLNETNWGFEDTLNDKHGLDEQHNEPLKKLFTDITKSIREVDKKHIIIIEGNGWGNNYRGMFPLWDDNMVLSFHKYWNANDLQSIQYMLDYRKKYHVPVWCGETGENSNIWFTDAIRLFENNNIDWSWWPLKKLGINNPLQIKANAAYNRLVDYWNGKAGNPPSKTDAYKGLITFATDTKFENNIIHHDVIDAMMRQPFSNKTVAFKEHFISSKDSVIQAVDYDLGAENFAYFDAKDTTGRDGNDGGFYRNDGVDIYKDASQNESYYVGNIDEGEWLTYTITVLENGRYAFKLITASENGTGNITINVDSVALAENIPVPKTADKDFQTFYVNNIHLTGGRHTIRISANKGGFNFKAFEIVKP